MTPTTRPAALLSLLLPLLWPTACAPPSAATPAPARDAPDVLAHGFRVVAYYRGSTARRGFLPDDIPGSRLTHVNYAFAEIAPDGTLTYQDPCIDVGRCGDDDPPVAGWPGAFEGLRRVKAEHPHLRILLSVGGWGGSARFSDVALTAASRARFVRSAIGRFLDGEPGVFDGFDLDWEYPVEGGEPGNARRPEDRENFTLLLAEFRRQLDERASREGREEPYLLTIATAAGERHLANLELDRIPGLVDFINVMTYDYHTASSTAHFNAPLRSGPDDPTPELNIDTTVRTYLAAGVPADMLVLGVPFFGRGYADVPPENDGLYQPSDWTGEAARSDEAPPWGVGGIRYTDLASAERRGFRRHWHEAAQVPWLYDPETRVWISYDDPRSIAAKASYAREMGLGGVMFWELSGDDGSLLRAIHRGLTGEGES